MTLGPTVLFKSTNLLYVLSTFLIISAAGSKSKSTLFCAISSGTFITPFRSCPQNFILEVFSFWIYVCGAESAGNIKVTSVLRSYGDAAHCRKALHRAVQCTSDYPEHVCEVLLTFERVEGKCYCTQHNPQAVWVSHGLKS